MNKLSKIFLKKPGQWQFWIMLALLVKAAIFLFQVSHANRDGIQGLLGSVGGDTKTYIMPIDNFLTTGSYDPDFRMPGYGIFYLFLRLCFAKITALNALLILQCIAASLSVYALALSAQKIFRSSTMFYLTFYLFLISTYSNLEDATLLTESFATSFLVFAVFFSLKWYETYRYRYVIIAGLLITELIFLRPVFAPLVLLFSLFLLVAAKRAGKNQFFKYALVFMVPFILIDGAWTVRNYRVYQRIQPLTATLYGGDEDGKMKVVLTLVKFIQCWGGNYVWWDPASQIRYFNIREALVGSNTRPMRDTYKPIPKDIYTSVFNADSLAAIKSLIAQEDTDKNPATVDLTYNYINARVEAYGLSIKKEKPFLYYVVAPLRMFSNFFIHSGTYNLFATDSGKLNKLEFLIKIAYSLFYVFSLLLGFTGLLLLARKSLLLGPEYLVTGIVAFTTIIHPIVLRLCEARYFMPAWPFLLMLVAYTLLWGSNKITSKKTGQATGNSAA